MRLLLLRPCCFDLGGPLIGLCGHTEKLFCKAVRESRQSTGYGLGLIAAYGKVNDIIVDGIIANEPASVSQLRQFGWQVERFNFLRKVASLGFCSIHHALNTDSQHCARRSRGQIDDALRFFENFFCFLRHAINGRNSGTSWENNFSSYFKSQIFAVWTSPKTYQFWRIKLALVCDRAKTCSISSTIVVSIGSQFTSFKEAFQNRVLSKYRGGSAVRASHGFGFCHWRNV